MTPTRIALAALLALVASASASVAASQEPRASPAAVSATVRGTVRDSASGLPVAGAVIMLQDARGTTVSRNLSGTRGEFTVPLLPDARRARIIRLGYRPRVLTLPPAVAGSASDVRLDVVLASLPTLLQGIRVTADASGGTGDIVVPDARCASRPDREQALALLDQARAGLLALVVAREANPARVTRVGFTRTMDPTGTRIVHQRIRVDSAADQTVSFDAVRSAGEFVREGFRAITDDVQTLYAPDADILLDDAFTRGYCFHLAPADSARGNEAGLAFRPASRRRGRVDIEGALWIDTVARALVNIEFQYRGVEEQAERLGAGGYIGFRDVPGGVTMIDRWWLRLVGGALTPSPQRGSRERVASPVGSAFTVTEIGGELAQAVWRDGSRWESPLGTLQLTMERPDGTMAPGVGVGLEGTQYRAISDVAGRVTFRELVPGPYRVVVVDPLLVPLGVVLPTPEIMEARRATTKLQRVLVPTAESFLADACGISSRSRRSAWIVARVMHDDGAPVNDAKWRLRRLTTRGWTTLASGEGPGSVGLIHDCVLLEQRDQIELRAWRDGGAEAQFVGQLRDPVTAIALTFPATVAARAPGTPGFGTTSSGAPSSGTPNSGAVGSVVLSGTVTDSLTGALVPDARVSLAGTLLEAVTDSSGRFLLAGIPRGEYTVETSSPWLDSIGAVKRVKVSATGDSASVTLHLPSLSQTALAACGVADVSGVIVGRVGLPDGGVLPGVVSVVAEWTDVATGDAPATGRGTPRSLRVRSDPRGTFRLCGVPAGTPLALRAESEGTTASGASPVIVVIDAARRFVRADLVLKPSDGGSTPFAGTPDRSRDRSLGITTHSLVATRLADIPVGTHAVPDIPSSSPSGKPR